MAQGKTPDQLKETAFNLAKTQGIDPKQIMGVLSNAEAEATRALMTANVMQELRDQLQAAQLQLGNLSQTQNIINAVRPFPQPAYITCSPYTSVNGFGCGNGCGIV